MTDHEDYIFNEIATKLREEYGAGNIYVIGKELSNEPPKFPAVSLGLESTAVNERYSTFKKIENVGIEIYKAEAVSNDTENGKEECKKIINIINKFFENNGYIRTFNEEVKNTNPYISRRIARYKNSNSIGGK